MNWMLVHSCEFVELDEMKLKVWGHVDLDKKKLIVKIFASWQHLILSTLRNIYGHPLK